MRCANNKFGEKLKIPVGFILVICGGAMVGWFARDGLWVEAALGFSIFLIGLGLST